MRFENKSVIITGGGGKIAKAYATAFAKEGANLCLPDITSADSMVKAIQDMGGTAISMPAMSRTRRASRGWSTQRSSNSAPSIF